MDKFLTHAHTSSPRIDPWAKIMNCKLLITNYYDRKAHVFVWNGENWQEQAELIHTPITTNDAFGHAVAIDSDIIVIGAPDENHKAGAAYIFQCHGTTWQKVAKLTASDAQPSALFSYGSVSIDGDTIVIVAVDHRNCQRPVYVFHKDKQHWIESAKLLDPQANITIFIKTGDREKADKFLPCPNNYALRNS